MSDRLRDKKIHTWMRRDVVARLKKYCQSTGFTRPAAIERGLNLLFKEPRNALRID